MIIDSTVYWFDPGETSRYKDKDGIVKPDVPRRKGMIEGAYFGERHRHMEDGPFGLNLTIHIPDHQMTISPTYTRMEESKGIMRALGAATTEELAGKEVMVYFDLITGKKPMGLQHPRK